MIPRSSSGLYLPTRKPRVATPVDLSHPLALGLVGAWAFNEGARLVWNAAQPAETPVALIGNTVDPTWTVGRYGTTSAWIGSDGSNGLAQRLDTAVTDARYRLQAQSIALWLRTGSITGTPPRGGAYSLISRSYDITVGGFEWAINQNTGSPRLAFAYYDGGIEGWYLDTTVLANNTEYVLAATWTAGTVRFYVNGSQSSTTGTTSGTITHPSGDTLQVGFQSTGASLQNSSFDGQLHQALLYNRVLSASEVAALYAEPFAVYRQQTPARLIFDLGTPAGPSAQTVFPNAIGTAESVPSPIVSLAGSTQTVVPNAVATGEVVYGPTVTLRVLPNAIASGEVVHAASTPTVLTWPPGPSGALQINSLTSYVYNTLSGFASSSQPLTLALWARMDAATAQGEVMCILDSAITSVEGIFTMWSNVSNGTTQWEYASVIVADVAFAGPNAGLGNWHHLAFTIDTSGVLRGYMDGVQVGSASNTATMVPFVVTIGLPVNSTTYMNGALARARLWSAVLSQTEIFAEMYGATAVRSSNLYGDWVLASDLLDSSGGGHTLTAGGTAVFVSPTLEVDPGTISSGEVVYAPTVTVRVLPNAIASAESVASPTVTLTTLPGTISSAEAVLAPSVVSTVLPGTIATAAAMFAPTVTLSVVPDLVATAESVPAPTVSMGSVTGEISPGTILSGEVVFGPTVSQIAFAGAIPTAESVPGPTVLRAQTVTAGTIGTAESVPGPTVAQAGPQTLQPGTIGSGAAVYAPAVFVVGAIIPVTVFHASSERQTTFTPRPRELVAIARRE